MSLKKFLKEQNNQWWKADRQPVYPEDPDLLLPRHLTELADRLASDLSPESLTCDGERPAREVRARSAMLMAAKAELEALGVAIPAY